ncbi:MAG: alpha/beta hydrolase family protein [Acidimicrobiales bacterium]
MITTDSLEMVLQGPLSGADRAALLAHGAGADMHAAALVTVADALEKVGVPSLRFNYPFRTAGKRFPDRPAVLEVATRQAAAELSAMVKLPYERLIVGGRSMGGRYCSLVVGSSTDPLPALGLLLLGYPLHPAGKPDRLRIEHFPFLRLPVLFVSGTRDALASREQLEAEARSIPGSIHSPGTQFTWVEGGNHDFRVLKSSGRTNAQVLTEIATTVVTWVTELA